MSDITNCVTINPYKLKIESSESKFIIMYDCSPIDSVDKDNERYCEWINLIIIHAKEYKKMIEITYTPSKNFYKISDKTLYTI